MAPWGIQRRWLRARRCPRCLGGRLMAMTRQTFRKLAMRVLSQFPYAGACERVWSEYGFIHSAPRNCLGELRAQA